MTQIKIQRIVRNTTLCPGRFIVDYSKFLKCVNELDTTSDRLAMRRVSYLTSQPLVTPLQPSWLFYTLFWVGGSK